MEKQSFRSIKEVSIWFDENKKNAKKLATQLENWLKRKNISCIINKLTPSSNLILTIGGDGIILKVARLTVDRGIPLLGINLGGLGFLAETNPQTIYDILKKILAGNYNIEKRMLLEGYVLRNNEKIKNFIALNDVVVKNGLQSRMIRLELSTNGQKVATYLGDGLIIATPTGSTAYSLSAQGPLVVPDMELFVVSPICPHTLTLRPLIISVDRKLKIKILPENSDLILNIDGQEIFPLTINDEIVVGKYKNKLNLIVSSSKNYYQIWQTKLKWGRR